MATTRVNFRLPEGLVERADLAAAVTGDTRTGVVTDALESHLGSMEGDASFEAALVEKYLDGEIGDAALDRVLGRRDAAAVRASAALLDEGDAAVASLVGEPE